MDSSQRACLRKAANGMKTTFHVGKESVNGQLIEGISQALTARELVKVAVLPAAGLTAREAADALAGSLEAQVVQVIGSRFILYRQNPDVKKYGIK